jgi:UTP--glucose-1-phosphate uridylyltransferase
VKDMIKKAVIPAAGLGTRMHPITRFLPKPMIPIGTTPVLDYVIEEAWNAGIQEIGIIIGHKGDIIRDYYQRDSRVTFIEQLSPKGLGDAILTAKEFIGTDDFAILFGDMIIQSTIPCLAQLIEVYQTKQSSVLALEERSLDVIQKYNAVFYEPLTPQLVSIQKLIEKPKTSTSSLTSIGRMIVSPSLFIYLEQTPPGKKDEIQLTDALDQLAKNETLLGYLYEGRSFDIGSKDSLKIAINELL